MWQHIQNFFFILSPWLWFFKHSHRYFLLIRDQNHHLPNYSALFHMITEMLLFFCIKFQGYNYLFWSQNCNIFSRLSLLIVHWNCSSPIQYSFLHIQESATYKSRDSHLHTGLNPDLPSWETQLRLGGYCRSLSDWRQPLPRISIRRWLSFLDHELYS